MKKRIKLTESDLKNIIKESVETILNENNPEQLIKQIKQHAQEELKLYQELETFLKRNGVQYINLKDNGYNMKLSLPTTEYNKEVKSLLNRFASSKQMFIKNDVYPATTYISLTRY